MTKALRCISCLSSSQRQLGACSEEKLRRNTPCSLLSLLSFGLCEDLQSFLQCPRAGCIILLYSWELSSRVLSSFSSSSFCTRESSACGAGEFLGRRDKTVNVANVTWKRMLKKVNQSRSWAVWPLPPEHCIILQPCCKVTHPLWHAHLEEAEQQGVKSIQLHNPT